MAYEIAKKNNGIIKMSEDKDSVRIRPSARLIKTIGEDLIGDSNSAIIETS